MAALAALSVIDEIAEASSRASSLLDGVDQKLLVTRDQIQNASVKRDDGSRGGSRHLDAGTLQLTKTLLTQFACVATIEGDLNNGAYSASFVDVIHNVLEVLVSQEQANALNLHLLIRLREVAHHCHNQAAKAVSSWASGHEDAVCRLLPGAFERLTSANFAESNLALADLPFAPIATLTAGFENLLARSWPPRSALDRVTGLRTVPTRFPGIISTWGMAADADSWSLPRFLGVLDHLAAA